MYERPTAPNDGVEEKEGCTDVTYYGGDARINIRA